MIRMRVGLVTVLLGVLAIGQQDSGKKSDSARPNPMSGKQLFATFCAMCHGAEARGGGPFSPQLKTWPPDLTRLKSENQGVFPSLHVAEVIDGEFNTPAHGSKEMPVWGPVFRSLAHGREDSAQRRIDNLVKYIESVQQK
ncbi:MAG TPA: cytochrome c [Terriglobales bacterium]|nr:cytochrome c [Terriglobales bacterium]